MIANKIILIQSMAYPGGAWFILAVDIYNIQLQKQKGPFKLTKVCFFKQSCAVKIVT